jgi:hypothetical protein
MDLVDRYLHAVKFWLPQKQKQDILAELAEDLHSQVEEREAGLGRKLNEAEIADLLKQRGRPMLVANSFRPQQYLIGPALFPIYIFVLKVTAALYLLPWILVWIGMAVSRAAHSGQSLGHAMASFWTAFWPTAFAMAASVTVIFAILERVQTDSRFLEHWDPHKLPPVRDPNRIPLSNSILEVIINLVFLSWLIGGAWYERVLHFSDLTITLSAAWHYFFWGFVILTAANAVASAINVFHPYWTVTRASIRVISDCIGSALFCWLLKGPYVLAGLSSPDVPPEKMAHIVNAINWWASKMFPFAVVACVLIVLGNAYRVLRVRSNAGSSGLFSAAATI